MPEVAIIFSFILVTTIVSFMFGSGIHKRQIAYKERKDAIERERADGNSGGSNEKVKQLEERVRVLERLATDRGQTLADEINALRDERDERGDTGTPIPQQSGRQADREMS